MRNKKLKILTYLTSVILLLTIILLSSLYKAEKQNNKDFQFKKETPIVFVHGFMGNGRNDKDKKHYWGGDDVDLQEFLKQNGFNAMTATVSPFSSNWHRACELYAFIKGGVVDYGKNTSEKYGHSRYGRKYTGLYPKWDKNHPIHIVAHSQGGQTARVLAHLLNFGSKEEIEKTEKNNISKLFNNNKDNKGMILSITTIATPHDGTTYVKSANDIFKNKTFRLFPFLASINAKTKSPFFDYQLDHWNLNKNKNESLSEYFDRLKNSSVWSKEKAFALYDLSPEGAKELNKWVKEVDDIYYFSYSCQITEEKIKNNKIKYFIPRRAKAFMESRNALSLAKNINNYPLDEINQKYAHSDGTVNTYSAVGPHIGRDNINIVSVDNNTKIFKKGIWNSFPTIKYVSHLQVLGKGTNKYFNTKDFYLNLANQIYNLEK